MKFIFINTREQEMILLFWITGISNIQLLQQNR